MAKTAAATNDDDDDGNDGGDSSFSLHALLSAANSQKNRN